MTDKRIFILAHPAARARVVEAIRAAPDGWKVTLSEPTRSLDQNAALWPLLECFSKQKQWPVNGEMQALAPEEWKDILTAAFDQEMVRMAKGISGGMVMLGRRTSKFGKRKFSEFLEFIHATAADLGIRIENYPETAMNGDKWL